MTMKSLLISDGDLVVGPGGFLAVEGTRRVIQDLGLAVRETYGSDRFHSRWGSILDGFIGRAYDVGISTVIEAEMRRVVGNYIAIQQATLTADASANRPSRFSTDEILVRVNNVDVQQSFDSISLTADLGTMGNTSVTMGALR